MSKNVRINFTKYEGAGNDFVLLDLRNSSFEVSSKLIAKLCDRHFGVGADGLMTLSEGSGDMDCSMRYYNADGSLGEMCGNGARCFALFAHHLGIGGSSLLFDSVDGAHHADMISVDGDRGQVRVGIIDVEQIQRGDGWYFLNTGVPHYVEFVESVDSVDVVGRGSKIRYDLERFAKGTNVNFVQILGDGHIRMRTYERGVEAETLACGTGATAAAIITELAQGAALSRYVVQVPGGELQIDFKREGESFRDISLTGGARRVFYGSFEPENFE